MNLSQKQTILNLIEQILSFDFDRLIVENNMSGNIDEIQFGDFSVLEFKTTYLKVFRQLKAELENGLGLMLPNQEVFSNEFGSVTLDSESANFLTYLQNFANRASAAEVLKRFVYYQIREGFWNKSTAKKHSIEEEKLKEAQENLILVEKVLSSNIAVFDKLKSDFEGKLAEFLNILTEKNRESAEITSLLEKAKTDNTNINSLATSATTKEAEISGLTVNIKDKLKQIIDSIETYEDDFEAIKTQNKTLSEQLTADISEAQSNLKNSREGNEYIQNQKDQITRLIGMAADGSLGYKFNSRKEDLERSVNNFWRYAVPGSILIALAWVILVFTCLNAHLSNEWINLLVNVIKTSPAWLLVGFVFSQYSKERNLQEEYAFKSAIAMTLTAYSEMLSEDDGNTTKTKSSKQEMLLKSIENLYTQPILKPEKSENPELINSKPLIESIKSITDMVKNIKS